MAASPYWCPMLVVLVPAAGGCFASHSTGDDVGGDLADGDDTASTDIPGPWDAIRCNPDTCPAEMAYVPCGPFVMGSDPWEGWAGEQPEHIVWLSAFCIDRLEVTHAGYSACAAAGACPREPIEYPSSGPDYPIGVGSRSDAIAFCGWNGKSVPTEAQWEKAGRGGCEIVAPPSCGPEDERDYPWGDSEPTCDKANFWSDFDRPETACVGHDDVVGVRPAGASPYGVLDMAGNLSEYVSDVFYWYAECGEPCVDPRHDAPGEGEIGRGGAYHPALEVGVRHLRVNDRSFPEGNGVRCALDL